MTKGQSFAEKTEIEIVKEAIEALLAQHPSVALNILHTIQVTEALKTNKQ